MYVDHVEEREPAAIGRGIKLKGHGPDARPGGATLNRPPVGPANTSWERASAGLTRSRIVAATSGSR